MARLSIITNQILARAPAEANTALARHSDERVSQVAVRAYARIAAAWKLPNAAAAKLIGVSERTWGRIKADNWNGALDQDQLMRVSAVTGLYKALHLYFSDKLADRWVCMANKGDSFGGHKPIDLMLAGGLPAIMGTRDYVDAIRGGV